LTETRQPRARFLPTVAALASIGLLCGAAAGLLDATRSWTTGRIDPSPGLYLYAVSFGALVGGAALATLGLLIATVRWPRVAGSRLAVAAAALGLGAAAVPWGKRLYHGIPWDAAEWAIAAAGVLLAVGVLVLAARAARRLQASRLLRGLAAAALPLLLISVPAGLRVVPALGPPEPSEIGAPDGDNLLLLTVDTLRPDCLGSTGHPDARTPWIDRITRRAVVFADCQSAAPWTLPSLGTMLTGTFPGEHRVLEEISGIAADVPTLAETCRESGRRTAAFVSNPWLAPGGLARGFQTFDVAERLECLSEIRTTRLYATASKVILRTQRLDSAERIMSQGEAWIRNGRGSWFLWLHAFDPHLPNWPDPPFDRLFGPPPVHAELNLTVEAIRANEFPGGAAGRAEIERLYDGEVTYTDLAIGKLWKELDSSGVLANTAVVFSADHGEEFWEHDDYGHGHTLFDEVVRVPFAVRVPGGAPGRVDGRLVATVDIAPTALAAAGLRSDGFRGRDRLREDGAPRIAYGEALLYGEEQKYLRTPEWKAVLRPGPDGEGGDFHLYNVVSDPGEQADVAASRPDLADSLHTQLRSWMELVGSEGAMGARDPEKIDPVTLRQLEALGYISTHP
jgi:arylsulfatase A-like enzyme